MVGAKGGWSGGLERSDSILQINSNYLAKTNTTSFVAPPPPSLFAEASQDKANLEKIKSDVTSKFGNVVSVDHRIMGTDSDNLFEVWIEAYEHELLFSRRSAVYDKDWTGGKNVEEEWEKMIDVIEDMVSDDSKFSYLV